MKTLTGQPGARITQAQFPVDNVDQQTAASIEPASQAALDGVAQAYAELNAIDGRVDALEAQLSGAGSVDARLDAVEAVAAGVAANTAGSDLTNAGNVDARLDALEQAANNNFGKGAFRMTGGGGQQIGSVANPTMQFGTDLQLGIDAVPGGFTDSGYWSNAAPEKLVVPFTGRYRVEYRVSAAAGAGSVAADAMATLGGTFTSLLMGLSQSLSEFGVVLTHGSTVQLTAGDSVQLRVAQSSGGNIGVSGRLALTRVG